MNYSTRSRWIWGCGLAGWLIAGGGAPLGAASATNGAAGRAATQPATNAAPAFLPIPKSFFTFEPATRGKDPFNPAKPPVETVAQAPAAQGAPAGALSALALKGIILGAGQRRLAVINNRDFAVGEAADVTIPGGKVNVHCWEIGDGYVVVTVAGVPERQTLRMRKE